MWISQKSILLPLKRISHDYQTSALFHHISTKSNNRSLVSRPPDHPLLTTTLDNYHAAPEFPDPGKGEYLLVLLCRTNCHLGSQTTLLEPL